MTSFNHSSKMFTVKIIMNIFGLVLALNSCCQDCGVRAYHTKYSMQNKTGQDIVTYWYSSHFTVSNPKVATDSFSLSKGEEVVLHYYRFIPPTGFTEGVLDLPEFFIGSDNIYDSVQVKFMMSGTVQTYDSYSISSNSPLYKRNYRLVRSVDNKKERIKEYLLVFN